MCDDYQHIVSSWDHSSSYKTASSIFCTTYVPAFFMVLPSGVSVIKGTHHEVYAEYSRIFVAIKIAPLYIYTDLTYYLYDTYSNYFISFSSSSTSREKQNIKYKRLPTTPKSDLNYILLSIGYSRHMACSIEREFNHYILLSIGYSRHMT